MKATTRLTRKNAGARSSRRPRASSPTPASTAHPCRLSPSGSGVSQPYLFQLFGSKKDLFIAAVRRCFERTIGTFRAAAADAGPDASPRTS